MSFLSPPREVTGVPGADSMPPIGVYRPAAYKNRWPRWWPMSTPVGHVDYVRVRMPKSIEEGRPHERIVDFTYKRGFEPK